MHALKRGLLAICLIASIAMADLTAKTNLLNQGIHLFSSNFVKSVAQEEQGNLICSPLSVDIALAMAAVGSNGETKSQFINVLKLPGEINVQTLESFRSLIDALNNVENITLKLANKAFIGNDFPVNSEYKNSLQTYFHSDIESVDFSQSQKAAAIINNWCKLKTNDRIDSIVQPETLDPSLALLLANAVYFKGKWAHEFNPQDTSDLPFHVDANTVKQVPTMYRKGDYIFADLPEYDAKCIELPYANKEISMVIILPNKVDGLPALTETLSEVIDACNTRLKQAHPREVKLYLPKFKTETKLDLKNTLSDKMGLTAPFGGNADFSGISPMPLYISKVIQKAFIEVNEEGSEAAAVTGVFLQWRSMTMDMTPVLRVERPFFYGIFKIFPDRELGNSDMMPLFVGTITEPLID